MKTFELAGEVRSEVGKKATKAVRSAEAIPCVLYGGKENVHFTVTESAVRKLVYSPDVFVVNLTVGGVTTTSIMKELQFHPVTDKILHLDFLEISETKPVVVEVPVQLLGLAEGVKAGGKLSLETRKLKVKGLYKNIPEKIDVDVTSVGLGKTVQVGKLQVKDLEILNNKNAVVAQVKLTRAARGAAEAAANASK
ncbi:MAG TPA: 50S ribosomal protein L25/general stress protein Ctc [Paludibacteraceae bacterium]|jgi:large subunit ribosomal protein L25|nr:50S ribosomal protein L25/general stress protein Ctc [Paludibacteraceae bacterium]HPS11115.1 50S ribosomal protein L25/general stress protein Ctc [Paludibacteraceae bacterium]